MACTFIATSGFICLRLNHLLLHSAAVFGSLYKYHGHPCHFKILLKFFTFDASHVLSFLMKYMGYVSASQGQLSIEIAILLNLFLDFRSSTRAMVWIPISGGRYSTSSDGTMEGSSRNRFLFASTVEE